MKDESERPKTGRLVQPAHRDSEPEANSDGHGNGSDNNENPIETPEPDAVLNYEPESEEERVRLWKTRIVRHAREILRAAPEYHYGWLTFQDVEKPLTQEIRGRVESTAHNSAYAVFQPPSSFRNGDLEHALSILVEAAWEDFKQYDRNNLLLDNLNGLPEPPKPAKRGTLTMSVTPKASEWLWENHIQIGKICDIQGDPGTGKSAITAYIAAVVSTGGLWPTGERCEGGGVIMINGEEDLEDGIVPHLIAAGADRRRIKAYTLHDDPLFELPRDLDLLEEDVKELKVRAVIVDPLDCFVSENVEINKNQIVRRYVLAALARMAAAYKFSVIQVRHLNKDAKTKVAMYRGTGSIALNAASRAVWMVGLSPDEPNIRVMAMVKISNAPQQRSLRYELEQTIIKGSEGEEIKTLRVKWLGECDIKASELLRDPPSEKSEEKKKLANDKIETACAALRAILSDGAEHDSADIEEEFKAQGISRNMMFKAKAGIKAKGRQKGFHGGWVWFLPTEYRENSENAQSTAEDPQSTEGGFERF